MKSRTEVPNNYDAVLQKQVEKSQCFAFPGSLFSTLLRFKALHAAPSAKRLVHGKCSFSKVLVTRPESAQNWV